MSSVIVSVMPFAGHVAPTTGVVTELLARGHSVRVYTGAKYAETFARLGARVVPWSLAPDFDETNLPAAFPQLGRRGPRGLLDNLEHLFIRSAVGQARDLVAEIAREPADILVGDVMSLGTRLAAELTGLPWATLSIVPLSMPSVDLPPGGLGLQPGFGGFGALRDGLLRGIVRRATGRVQRAYRSVRDELALPAGAQRFELAWYSPMLVIASGTPALEYPRSDLPPTVHFVGRLPAAARPSSPLPEWWPELLATTKPVVLVTQGTFNTDTTELIQPALAALADEDAFVIATADLPFAAPANTHTAAYIPFSELLPLTDVVITNGGWGGVLESLANGIPLIVAGGDLDKPDIAARVAWSRAGIDLGTGRPTSRAIARAYAALGESHRERARGIQSELAGSGAARAVDLIEQLIAER